jgi:hypothetical protein
MHSDYRTELHGTFIRWRKDTLGRDYSPVPLLYDRPRTECYKFRMRRRRWIEALVSTVHQNPDLHWIIQAGYAISLSGYHYGPIVVHPDGRMTRPNLTVNAIPRVYLVPLTDWYTTRANLATARCLLRCGNHSIWSRIPLQKP